MKQQKVFFLLLVIAVILTMFLTAGIGYAAVTENTLINNNNLISAREKENFKVSYVGIPTYTGDGNIKLEIIDGNSAILNITGLKVVGDTATASINIKNTSYNMKAVLSSIVENSNPEYFNVTATLSKQKLTSKADEATLKISVQLIKLPLNGIEKTNITIKVSAKPEE